MFQRRKPEKKDGFMYYVQLHERGWGFETYAGRPALEDILAAKVVIFWQQEGKADRYTVTLHDELKDVEKLFYQLVLRSNVTVPKKRIVRIYYKQKRIIPKSVRIAFEAVEDE